MGDADNLDVDPVGKGLFLLGFYGVALCMGGIKANVASLGADQFDEKIEEHRRYREIFSPFSISLSRPVVLQEVSSLHGCARSLDYWIH